MERWVKLLRWLWATPWPVYALTMMQANIIGAVFVFAFLRFVLPLDRFLELGEFRFVNQYLFIGYLVLAFVGGVVASTLLIFPVLRADRIGDAFDGSVRDRALRIPFHQSVLSAAIWAIGTLVFVGVNPWVVATAKLLQEHNIPVLVVARNYAKLSIARMAGLTTQTANILSEFAVKDMDFAGIGYFIACTPDDETNATAARQFTHVFGGANTYQLHRDGKSTGTGSVKQDTAGHLTARFAFVPQLSLKELDHRMASGMTVKMTSLSSEFTLDDFTARYGEDTVILFVKPENSTITVADRHTKIPTESGSLIAMVREPVDV